MKEFKIKCPNCGENLAKIIYGLVPDPGEDLKKKKVFIGGCMISDNDPVYHCYNCRRSYFENLTDYIEEANDIFDDYYETKKDIGKNQNDSIDDDPFASYDIHFDSKIPEDKRLNKIYNIENPFDYVDMDEFKDNSN